MEIRRLYRSIVEMLHEAIKHRGSTLADQQYVDLLGRAGEYQQLHKVYDRAGQPCNRCRADHHQGEVPEPQHLLLPLLPDLGAAGR